MGKRRRVEMETLDYEKKVWGSQTASLSIFNGYCLPLKYSLKSIGRIKGEVLDVGCGAGALTAALKRYRPDLDLVGLDFSQKCIQLARKRHPKIKFIRGDVHRLPFEKEAFEAVLANHLIEHLYQPQMVLEEICRVLKPGGVFFSSTPLEGNWSSLVKWLRAIRQFKDNRVSYLGHQQAFSQKEYLGLLRKAGFVVKKINWSGFITYQLIDTIYYPLLQLLGKKPEYLAEVVMLEFGEKKQQIVYTFSKSLLNLANHLESFVWRKIPGLIIHVKATKMEIADGKN